MTVVLHGLDAAARARADELRAQSRYFWLDVSLGETGVQAVREALGLPESAARALQGPADSAALRTVHADAQAVVFLVRCHVADERAHRLRAVDVRVALTGEYLLTLHQEPVSLPAALAVDLPEERSKGYVVYSVLDAMLANSFDALEEVQVSVDALAEAWTGAGAGREPRATLRESGARLAALRRWTLAQQAAFERVFVEIGALRGFETSEERSFDRLDAQSDRLLSSIDAIGNTMGMLLDLQLNERAYVVSVVAAIFVPLTFVTGFFGMNFGWMIDHIDTLGAFLLLAFAVPIATGVMAWRSGSAGS